MWIKGKYACSNEERVRKLLRSFQVVESASRERGDNRQAGDKSRGRDNHKMSRIVLEDEEYMQGLSEVIKRDFFPLLQADASSVGDIASINDFNTKFTSKDDVEYGKLQQKTVEAQREKLDRLYSMDDSGERRLENVKSRQVVLHNDVFKKPRRKGTRNALFFPQAHIGSSGGAGKRIIIENTRLEQAKEKHFSSSVSEVSEVSSASNLETWRMVESTPRIVPSVDVEIIETWGVLEATPIRLSSTPSSEARWGDATLKSTPLSTPRTPRGSNDRKSTLSSAGRGLLSKVTRR